jgi:hypothetical protein
MDQSEQKDITLVVDDEQALYTKFSPEHEFNESVKSYIKSKAAGKGDHQSISLTVVSQGPVDEERFRAAVANWIRDEKAVFGRVEKDLIRTLVGLLVFGSIMIVLSMALQQRFELLKYSLIPILGSLALSKAAGILVLKMPVSAANKRLIHEMEENSVIKFEVGRGSPGDDSAA